MKPFWNAFVAIATLTILAFVHVQAVAQETEPVTALRSPAVFATSNREGFEARFNLTEPQYQRRIRWLRGVGWSLMGGALLTGIGLVVVPHDSPVSVTAAFGAIIPAFLIVGGALLLRARLMVGRRRRWKRDHPGAELSLTWSGSRACLELTF